MNAQNVCLMFFVLLTADRNLEDGVTYQQMQVSFSEKLIWIFEQA